MDEMKTEAKTDDKLIEGKPALTQLRTLGH